MPSNKESFFQKLFKMKDTDEIDAFFSLDELDFQKIGVVLKLVGMYMAVKEKFRATLDYDPEKGRYYVSIKFYGSGIPEEILVAQKAEADYLAKKK